MHVAQIVWVRKMTKTSGLSAANEDRIQPYLTKARAHNLEMVRRLLKMSLGARLSGDVKPYSRNKLGEIMGVQPERTSWISQVSRADLRVQKKYIQFDIRRHSRYGSECCTFCAALFCFWKSLALSPRHWTSNGPPYRAFLPACLILYHHWHPFTQ